MPGKFEKFAIGLTKSVFEDQGHWHAQAFFRSRGRYELMVIESFPDAEQVEQVRLELSARDADAYVVTYLGAKFGSKAADDERGRLHDFVVPPAGAVPTEASIAAEPDERMFVFVAFRDRGTRAYAMDVIKDRELGPLVEVTGIESPFVDLFRRDPKTQAYGRMTQ